MKHVEKANRKQTAHEEFVEYIEETTSPVMILGYEYNQAEALRELDPIAYRQAFLDWLEYQYTMESDEDE